MSDSIPINLTPDERPLWLGQVNAWRALAQVGGDPYLIATLDILAMRERCAPAEPDHSENIQGDIDAMARAWDHIEARAKRHEESGPLADWDVTNAIKEARAIAAGAK